MKKEVAILTPTFQRPERILNYKSNIESVTDMNIVDIIFIVEDDDHEVKQVCLNSEAKVLVNKRKRNYAGAINTAVQELDYNYFFVSADDFKFHANWLPPLLRESKSFAVIGPEDLGNPMVRDGMLAVSSLVRKDYVPFACLGFPDNLLFEGYHHNYVDTELTQTAIYREQYKYCPTSIVEHMHPNYGKSTIDSTYGKSMNMKLMMEDEHLFNSRRHLWESLKK